MHWLNLLADFQVRPGPSLKCRDLPTNYSSSTEPWLRPIAPQRLARVKLDSRPTRAARRSKLGTYEANIGLKKASAGPLRRSQDRHRLTAATLTPVLQRFPSHLVCQSISEPPPFVRVWTVTDVNLGSSAGDPHPNRALLTRPCTTLASLVEVKRAFAGQTPSSLITSFAAAKITSGGN